MASSRRGARRVGASSSQNRSETAAGADLESLVHELLELERHTERRERMLSRTQMRQREREERSAREALAAREQRDVTAVHQMREAAVARERLERLERRERRRNEARAARIESRERSARHDVENQNGNVEAPVPTERVQTSPRRSRSDTFESSQRRERADRADRTSERGADTERRDTARRDMERRDSERRDSERHSNRYEDRDDFAGLETQSDRGYTSSSVTSSESDHDDNANERVEALATEIARLRRRVARLSRVNMTPTLPQRDEQRWTSRSAPRPRRETYDGFRDVPVYDGYPSFDHARNRHVSRGARTAPRLRNAPPRETWRFHGWENQNPGWRFEGRRDRSPSLQEELNMMEPHAHARDPSGFDPIRFARPRRWGGGHGEYGEFVETSSRRRTDARRRPDGSPTPSLRPDSAIDWETSEHLHDLREAYVDPMGVGGESGGDGGFASSAPALGRFFDELQELRQQIAEGEEWFASQNSGGRGLHRPRGPWRDPRFASPLRSRSRARPERDTNWVDGTGRADDTADERGASPQDNFPPRRDTPDRDTHGETDFERNVARETSTANRSTVPEGDTPPVRETAQTQTRPVSGRTDHMDRPAAANVGTAGAELSRLLSERPGFSEMLAGVLASMRSLPTPYLREACVGVIYGTPPHAASEPPTPSAGPGGSGGSGGTRLPTGVVMGSLVGGDGSNSDSTSDSEFAYVPHDSSVRRGGIPRGNAYSPSVPVGAPWDGDDSGTGPSRVERQRASYRQNQGEALLDLERNDTDGHVTISELFGVSDPLATAAAPTSVPSDFSEIQSLVQRHAATVEPGDNTRGSTVLFGITQDVTRTTAGDEITTVPPPPPPAPSSAANPTPSRLGDPTKHAGSISPSAALFSDTPSFNNQVGSSLSTVASPHTLAVDADSIAQMVQVEQDAQREKEMALFADSADMNRTLSAADEAAPPPEPVSGEGIAEGTTPVTLHEAQSRLPFSETLNSTLMGALGAMVSSTENVVSPVIAVAQAADAAVGASPEALEALARSEARAAAAAAEIAAVREARQAALRVREARAAEEAKEKAQVEAPEAQEPGTPPPELATPVNHSSPETKKLSFKERLALFNAPTPN